jgi:hypothetical protein
MLLKSYNKNTAPSRFLGADKRNGGKAYKHLRGAKKRRKS